MHITIIAVGKNSKSSLLDLYNEYKKRINWKVDLKEITSKNLNNEQENKQILSLIPDKAIVIALDEKGKSMPSSNFADKFKKWQLDGFTNICFIIGGADGINNDVRDKANMLISFGEQTWPHMMVRSMLIEQIYRTQQILIGHPYHRQ